MATHAYPPASGADRGPRGRTNRRRRRADPLCQGHGREHDQDQGTTPEVLTPAEFVAPLRSRLRELGWSQANLAARVHCHPSTVSRALSGQQIPTPDLIQRIARVLRIAPAEVDRLVTSAKALRRLDRERRASGAPPVGLDSYDEMLDALRQLMRDYGISQRALERPGLRQSMVSAVLCGNRGASRSMVTAIVTACKLSDDVATMWDLLWSELGDPHQQRLHERRIAGLRRRRRAEAWNEHWMHHRS